MGAQQTPTNAGERHANPGHQSISRALNQAVPSGEFESTMNKKTYPFRLPINGRYNTMTATDTGTQTETLLKRAEFWYGYRNQSVPEGRHTVTSRRPPSHGPIVI